MNVTGARVDTCPWRLATDPFVQEVLSVYAARENGIGEALAGGWDATPRMLVEGVAEFERSYKRATAWYRARDEERRESDRRNAKQSR